MKSVAWGKKPPQPAQEAAYQCPDCGGNCKALIKRLAELLAAPQVRTTHGQCHDCAQGLLEPVHEGFELFIFDGRPSHWFCRYCGSNNVTIRDRAGNPLFEQGKLYAAGERA